MMDSRDRLSALHRVRPSAPKSPAAITNRLHDGLLGKISQNDGLPEIPEPVHREHARPKHLIFAAESIHRAQKLSSGGDPERRERVRSVTAMINEKQPFRELAVVPSDIRVWDDFEQDFPNFSQVIAWVREQCALASVGDGRFHLPPILLEGEPGVGKTAFVQRLAEVVGAPHEYVDMSGSQGAAQLTGTHIHWANSTYGVVLGSLMTSDVANSIFFLDEIEKTPADSHNGNNALAALLRLLEPSTARSFEDLSVPGLSMDASSLIWIAACNESTPLSAPILSRFAEKFDIRKPTLAQTENIVASVWKRMRSEYHWGQKFPQSLEPAVVGLLASLSPRDLRSTLLKSAAKAAYRLRTEITMDDVFTVLNDTANQGRRPIGFCSRP